MAAVQADAADRADRFSSQDHLGEAAVLVVAVVLAEAVVSVEVEEVPLAEAALGEAGNIKIGIQSFYGLDVFWWGGIRAPAHKAFPI